MLRKTLAASAIAALGVGLIACGGSDDDPAPPTTVGDTVVLTASGRLVSFNRATPGTQTSAVTVSGLTSGETLLGIDVRPADRLLWALASSGRLYTVDPATGAATSKATLRAAAGDDNPFTALAGTRFGFDFNPAADRLRVVSDTGQNLRVNVDTGDTITDGNIAPATGAASITAVAYTNSFAGTTSTRLFDIDAASGLLHLQDPPNAGSLSAGVSLGVTATAVNGFDVDARNNTGYAALSSGGASTLYSVNLAATSAAATSIGAIAGGEAVLGLALLTQPAPATAVGLVGGNQFITFDPRTPNTITTPVAITGLAAGEAVLGIDFRPLDNLLYALTTASKLYTVNLTTGAATSKSTLTVPVSGTSFSVDFNPAADRLRVISETGQNLRINADTGETTVDGAINRASGPASVVAAAYINSFGNPAPAATALFDLDANADVLAQQTPPNNGTLVNVGAGLGIDIAAGGAAFDIAGGGNATYAALRGGATGPFSLYSVSLTTGAATLTNAANPALAQIGGANGPALIDIAIRL